MPEEKVDSYYLSLVETSEDERQRRRRQAADERAWDTQKYKFNMGKVPIFLGSVEFRILKFLSATPYRAYTKRKIAEAVSTDLQPVTEETLKDYIASLRNELGIFCDYVQTVPYIGYRFKA